MDSATATPAAERGTGDYVQCVNCRHLHWESQRERGRSAHVTECPECGSQAFFVRQAPR